MDGLIFDVQRFCTHDGPGIRTTVFLKGCSLRCRWCHNPESQNTYKELLFAQNLCIDCKSCDKVCPGGSVRDVLGGQGSDRAGCGQCLKCADVCPSGAIEVVGRKATVEEILAEVEKGRVFYEESNGGLTLSGGEPLSQFEFCRELLTGAKSANIHTCVETCGVCSSENFIRLVPLVDVFLWDIKDTDAERHKRNTGGDFEKVVDNLRQVDKAGGKTILRCLLINGVNLTEQHIQGIVLLYKELENCLGVELLSYHPFGRSKYEKLGLNAPPFQGSRPTDEQIEVVRIYLKQSEVPCIGQNMV